MIGRLLVISHPAVVGVNQEVYRKLAERGLELTVVVPTVWRHEYASGTFAPQALPGLEDRLMPLPVALAGRPQRHFYLARPSHVLARTRPEAVFVEAEPFSIVAAQWSRALSRSGIPFGVQCAENIDRSLPAPVRLMRSRVLARAAFVAARSQTAGELARAWGAQGRVGFAPHAVPAWPAQAGGPDQSSFTVGYAGRLVPEKGLEDLLAAVRRLEAPVELLMVGDGELRGRLEGQSIPGSRVRVLSGIAHDQMASAYAAMDVLVLPSRTTARWKEQFGRVIVEALWCGIPVVGSDSGEIPWLIELTGGGLVFPEGDPGALAGCLGRLRENLALAADLAARGRRVVEQRFSVPAATDALQELLEPAG